MSKSTLPAVQARAGIAGAGVWLLLPSHLHPVPGAALLLFAGLPSAVQLLGRLAHQGPTPDLPAPALACTPVPGLAPTVSAGKGVA